MAIPPSPIPRGPVTATLNFAIPPADGSRATLWTEDATTGQPRWNYQEAAHAVAISDLRGREAEFSLDHDAFQAIAGVPPSAETAFADDESIQANYYPEVEALLLKHVPGSNKIVIFDHTVRRMRPGAPRAPVQKVHVDQLEASTKKRVHVHTTEADVLLQGRYRIINVWRPLNARPVESMPLALASAASVDPQRDIVPVDQIRPDGYVGQIGAVRYSPAHRWWYWSGMTGDERLLLECFDSASLRGDSGVKGGQVPHTAFVDPRTRPDAEGRESIEVRALVFGP
ncbi:hypothetical protein F4780DRAFT_775103 [Xylariomycetidae sp. FL0641]|nr:hypothetical protein F4780DRAFT_775103 [Xylariomycetidae sp. FL0641]